jgi:polyisoprenoid-binding protein YceI
MKTKTLLYLFISFILLSCSGLPKADKAVLGTTSEKTVSEERGEKVMLDTAASFIRFMGHSVGHSHAGRFKMKEGLIYVQEEHIMGGSFLIDIASMEMEEKSSAVQQKLRPHLLSGDFFDVQKYPEARFDIVKVEGYKGSSVRGANYMISGNLTMKGVTRAISFPANIQFKEGVVTGKANFNINRSWWNMSYGSDKSLGNKFISDEVNVELECRFTS